MPKMNLSHLELSLLFALAISSGCSPGAPTRASDIQNLNGISDDIAAVSMTQSDTRAARDPNTRTPIPRPYQTNYQTR